MIEYLYKEGIEKVSSNDRKLFITPIEKHLWSQMDEQKRWIDM